MNSVARGRINTVDVRKICSGTNWWSLVVWHVNWIIRTYYNYCVPMRGLEAGKAGKTVFQEGSLKLKLDTEVTVVTTAYRPNNHEICDSPTK